MGIHSLCMDSLLQTMNKEERTVAVTNPFIGIFLFPKDWRFLQFPDTPSESAFRCRRTTACIPGVREKDLIDWKLKFNQ